MKHTFKIAWLYLACDLSIHISKADNAPLVILETMVCGKSIVSTDARKILELIHEGITGYTVAIDNDQDMTDKIIALIKHSNLRERFGTKTAGIVRIKYDHNRMVVDCPDLGKETISVDDGK